MNSMKIYKNFYKRNYESSFKEIYHIKFHDKLVTGVN